MATSNWTSDDLKRIDAAIASGELLVAFDSGKVRYRNLDELLKIRQIIWDSIQASKGNPPQCIKTCQLVPVSNL